MTSENSRSAIAARETAGSHMVKHEQDIQEGLRAHEETAPRVRWTLT